MIIQTGTDLMNSIRMEGPENTLLYLHNLYNKKIRLNSLSFLRPPNCYNRFEHSSDVTQETWLSVLKDLNKFYSGLKEGEYASPLGWLLTINKHECLKHFDFHRKNSPLEELQESVEFQAAFLTCPTQIIDFEENEKRKIVQNIILTLSEKEQRILMLFFYEEVPYKVIGKILNIHPDNARQILCRTLRKIEKLNKNERL